MARGVKLTTPTDPVKRAAYKDRRAKNNESARKHREKTKQSVEEGKLLKERNEELEAEVDDLMKQLAEVESERDRLLEYLLTHECALSRTQREHYYNTFHNASSRVRNYRPGSNQSAPSRMEEPASSSSYFPPLSLPPHSSPSDYVPNAGYYLSNFSAQEYSHDIYGMDNHQLTTYHDEQNDRPTDFCLDDFPEREQSSERSSSDSQESLECQKWLDAVIAPGSGYTPLPGQVTPLLRNAGLSQQPQQQSQSRQHQPTAGAVSTYVIEKLTPLMEQM